MAYYIEKFGDIILPTSMTEETMDPVGARLRLVETTAGIFDADGIARTQQQFPHALTYRAMIHSESALAFGASLAALRAVVGTRATLTRRVEADSTQHTCNARLAAMPYTRKVENDRYIEITLNFTQLSPWVGEEHTESGVPGINKTVVNGGNLPQTDVVITITAGTNIITDPSFEGPGAVLNWTGTIPVSKALVIDCGARQVLLDGVNAYSGLALDALHTLEGWFVLHPGDNVLLQVGTYAFDGANWSITFKDRWA